MNWQPIETAPLDGRWFVASWARSNMHAIHIVQYVVSPQAGWRKLNGERTDHNPVVWWSIVPILPELPKGD